MRLALLLSTLAAGAIGSLPAHGDHCSAVTYRRYVAPAPVVYAPVPTYTTRVTEQVIVQDYRPPFTLQFVASPIALPPTVVASLLQAPVVSAPEAVVSPSTATAAVASPAAASSPAPGVTAGTPPSSPLEQRLARIEAALDILLAGPPKPQVLPVEKPPEQLPPAPDMEKRSAVDPRTLELHAAGILGKYCSECHTAPGRKQVAFFTSQGSYDPNKLNRRVAWAAIRDGEMPPGPKPKPEPQELAVLRRYLRGVD